MSIIVKAEISLATALLLFTFPVVCPQGTSRLKYFLAELTGVLETLDQCGPSRCRGLFRGVATPVSLML